MKVRGAKSLVKKLVAMPAKARKEISEAIEKGATELVSLQKAAVPVKTGRLKSSIKWQWGGHEIYSALRGDAKLSAVITAGGKATTVPVRKGQSPSYDYALGMEFGNKRSPSNPYFFPSYRLIKRRIKGRVTRAANKAAKTVAAG